MLKVSRRTLLTTGVVASVSSVIPLKAQASPFTSLPDKWDESYDVVVIGSGFAGLAAAAEAHNNKATVVVFEKMPSLGGNSAINGGIVSVPGHDVQKKRGIKDSPELLAKDMIREGQGYNYPDKVKTLADNAFDTWRWTVDVLKVQYKPDHIGQEGGHSVPRHIYTTNYSGSGIVSKQIEYLKSLGVPLRTRCYVETIYRDTDGRVKGIKIREGYRFPREGSGRVKNIKANKAVICCYGGFGADVKYRTKFDPKLTEKFDTTNQPGATSELWRETARIGAQQVQQDWIQCGPWTSPEEKGFGIALKFAQGAAAGRGMWIDCSSGKRFVNEQANRKVRADAIINRNNEGHKCIAIADTNGVNAWNAPDVLARQLEIKVVHKCDTLEALAKENNIPLNALKESIETYNKALKGQTGDEMGRMFFPGALPMEKGPWYYSILSPKVHHCMGGLQTDPQCHVIDVVTDQPIPGLYAAGEATGGDHGAVRLGSCGTLDCLVFGRIAGKEAAKEASWS